MLSISIKNFIILIRQFNASNRSHHSQTKQKNSITRKRQISQIKKRNRLSPQLINRKQEENFILVA